MAPVIADAALPKVEARAEHAAVQSVGELLDPAKQRFSAKDAWRRLEDSDAGVGLHVPGHPDDVGPGHDAVGVANDHVGVAPAPSAAEVGDVAALLVLVLAAMPIEDAPETTDLA